MSVRILTGDCRYVLRTLPAASVQCCVTSPPYFGLRDYGVDGQIGLEATPDAFVAKMVEVFREVRRVLRDDGTLWLNLGDSYARDASKGQHGAGQSGVKQTAHRSGVGKSAGIRIHITHCNQGEYKGSCKYGEDDCPAFNAGCALKPKDLMMIPARVALALQAEGWWLRSDIIWSKPNPMPESVTDRPSSSHEHVFLLTKSALYFYDADAIREADAGTDHPRNIVGPVDRSDGHLSADKGIRTAEGRNGLGRNARNVWTIATRPFPESHFATFPPALAERCIKAGSRPGDMVLDPFGGAGTTGLVADRLQRGAVLIELNPEYADLARRRIADDRGPIADAIEAAAPYLQQMDMLA